ncbi:MAG TPA: T9SS type A sorting domain-containing protein, partial [Chitinophagales bacterium]|nr:T9SS type A sorting domain-containing protein [Chitinophagales bacterium]
FQYSATSQAYYMTGSVAAATNAQLVDHSANSFSVTQQNSTTMNVTFNTDIKSSTLVLFDALSRPLFARDVKNVKRGTVVQLNTVQCSDGLYFLSLRSEKGTYAQRVVIAK